MHSLAVGGSLTWLVVAAAADGSDGRDNAESVGCTVALSWPGIAAFAVGGSVTGARPSVGGMGKDPGGTDEAPAFDMPERSDTWK